eukprot:TRINITY_DN109480_c0_g1_i1.p1 TRINITY_DN109480_c0_g1~~TRINITY_DN109480_c0_g1_i1.p1  ORF type:complete len:298 (-),score=46.72 TRINITY_DN109480_c0_g1_i1:68-892(-)
MVSAAVLELASREVPPSEAKMRRVRRQKLRNAILNAKMEVQSASHEEKQGPDAATFHVSLCSGDADLLFQTPVKTTPLGRGTDMTPPKITKGLQGLQADTAQLPANFFQNEGFSFTHVCDRLDQLACELSDVLYHRDPLPQVAGDQDVYIAGSSQDAMDPVIATAAMTASAAEGCEATSLSLPVFTDDFYFATQSYEKHLRDTNIEELDCLARAIHGIGVLMSKIDEIDKMSGSEFERYLVIQKWASEHDRADLSDHSCEDTCGTHDSDSESLP